MMTDYKNVTYVLDPFEHHKSSIDDDRQKKMGLGAKPLLS